MWWIVLIVSALDFSLVVLGFFLGRAYGGFNEEIEDPDQTVDITEVVSVIDGTKYTTTTTTHIEEA